MEGVELSADRMQILPIPYN